MIKEPDAPRTSSRLVWIDAGSLVVRSLQDFAASTNGSSELLKQAVSGGDIDTGIRDGLAIDKLGFVVNTRFELLISLLEIAFTHYSHDVRVSRRNLAGNVRGHNGLVGVDLTAVAV